MVSTVSTLESVKRSRPKKKLKKAPRTASAERLTSCTPFQNYKSERVMSEEIITEEKKICKSASETLPIQECDNKGGSDSDANSESSSEEDDIEERRSRKIPISSHESEFKSPLGFQFQSFQENSTASSLLGESNLEDKQIWYITVPSSINISSLKNIPSAALLNGTAVTKYNGDEYGFSKDPLETQKLKVLIPENSESGYKIVPKPISQILQLQQITDKEISTASQTEFVKPAIKVVEHKTIKQPKGLRMRFHHVGFGKENSEKFGDEMSSEESVKQVPQNSTGFSNSPPSPPKNKGNSSKKSSKRSRKSISDEV